MNRDEELLQQKDELHISCLEVTQDLTGFFYGGENWKASWHELCDALDLHLESHFKDNHNSFQSCFQFVEKESFKKVYRRVKVYNKLLALLQSRTVKMPLGINTNEIFDPSLKFGQELQEAVQKGLSRIEISYYAQSVEAEAEFFKSNFTDRAYKDIIKVLNALNTIRGTGYQVPMRHFLQTFQDNCRNH